MRKTKVVCTLGPSTQDPEVLEQLILAGMDVARFNFSHGDHKSHSEMFDKLIELRKKVKRPVAALLDTKGPEIRIGTFAEGSIILEKGQKFTITTSEVSGDQNRVSVTYPGFVDDVEEGTRVLIDDGLIELVVISKTKTDVTCEVINGGKISDRKGVNLPGTDVSMPFLSQKDKDDLLFGIKKGFDFVAASFTRSAADVMDIREFLDGSGGESMRIIAKIENMQGVNNIDDIIAVADGIMIARGDLGVEVDLEEVPVIQKNIIKKCIARGKTVITATQLLDSMIHNPRPTRAEAADVANAIYDGSGAVMLSGETASGQYPIESLKTMVRILERTERDVDYWKRFTIAKQHHNDITAAISQATCTVAMDLNARAIVTVTKSGFTARRISKFRPATSIIACSPSATVCRQMNLLWGVFPVLIDMQEDTSQLLNYAINFIKDAEYVHNGDLVVITAGLPIGRTGSTNMLKAQVVGEPCT